MIYVKRSESNPFIINQGDPGRFIFIVDRGDVAVEMPNLRRIILPEESILGELAPIQNTPRAASVRIELPTTRLWALDYEKYKKRFEKHMAKNGEIYKRLLDDLDIFSK